MATQNGGRIGALTYRTMFKPRPATGFRAKIKQLAPDKFAAFHRLLNEDITFRQMAVRVEAEFGMKVSKSVLSHYYARQLRDVALTQEGECTEIRLASFELLISCLRPGVIRIVAKELPKTTGEASPE